MRVFHFMPKEYAVSCIAESRFKVATLESMNDPYEFYVQIDEFSNEELSGFLKKHFNTKMGFLCFSKNLENPVQWAHYSDNHRGICIEFDIAESLLQEIGYLDSPPLISSKKENWKSEIWSVTLTKYKGWSYEEEYRMPVDLESSSVSAEEGLYFVSYRGVAVPKTIFTGLRCELSVEETDVFKSSGLPIIEMIQDSHSYSIVRA